MSKEYNNNSKVEFGECCKGNTNTTNFKVLITQYSKQNSEVIENYITNLFFDDFNFKLKDNFYKDFLNENLNIVNDELTILNTNNVNISTDIATQLAVLKIEHKITK
jgi:hypothetical protein